MTEVSAKAALECLEADLAAVEAIMTRLNRQADYPCTNLGPLGSQDSVPCARRLRLGWPSIDGALTKNTLSRTCDNCLGLLYASRLANVIRAEIHRVKVDLAESEVQP